MAENVFLLVRRAGCYSIYVLLLLLFTYLLNQLDRYIFGIVSRPMAQELHFGDKGCQLSLASEVAKINEENCTVHNKTACLIPRLNNSNEEHLCQWNYTGNGFEYQVLAGPIFVVVYTFFGIFVGFAADLYNRKNLLSLALTVWSVMTLLTGFVHEYWQLVLLRFGLGIGEAGCTPFAASLIAEYFVPELRGAAFGVYNFGIYTGYSLAYAVGNFITKSNIMGLGWRWTFFLCGAPGIVLAVVIFITVREPQRRLSIQADDTTEAPPDQPLLQDEDSNQDPNSKCNINDSKNYSKWTIGQRLLALVNEFTKPSLLLLCLAGSIRNGGGYVWAYNTQLYFESIHQSREQIGAYMSWIPLVAGSLGVLLGGFISDRVVKNRGPYARIFVVVISQVLAAPFAAGALFLSPPWAYISLIPSNILGEMWVSITLTVTVELVPAEFRTASIAVYLFIITNIGGNMPLLVPPINNAFRNSGLADSDAFRAALYIMYPAMYLLGAVLFLLALISMKRDLKKLEFKKQNE